MRHHSPGLLAANNLASKGRRLIGRRALFFVFLMIVGMSSVSGDDKAVQSTACKGMALVLKPVLELPQDGSGPVIRDGQLASPGEYPVSFLFETDHDKCTGFLVGARVLMTAAHCVLDSLSIRIEKKENDQTVAYEGQCEKAPHYPSDQSKDWALCLLSDDYQPPIVSGKPLTGYEVLNTDPTALTTGKRIQITGFGCTRKGGPLDEKYRVGWAEIDALPPGVRMPNILANMPNFVKIKKQKSALCGGDSGGPAFEINDKSPSFRRVIAINSQTLYDLGGNYGFLASTSTKDALNFFNQWAENHGQKICGLHKDAKNCRPTIF